MKLKQRKYNAILENFGALRNGLAGVVNDGVGIILDNPSEVVVVTSLHCFAHCQSQPRHFEILLLCNVILGINKQVNDEEGRN